MSREMIDLDWTVNETIQRHPVTARVFNAYGVDSCCGGGATLDAAARDSGVDPDTLVDALRLSLTGDLSGAGVA